MPHPHGRPTASPTLPGLVLPSVASISSVLDLLDLGVVMCDADGRVLLLNQQARYELSRGTLLSWAGPDRLCATDPATHTLLQAAWQGAARQGLRRLLLLREPPPPAALTAAAPPSVLAPTAPGKAVGEQPQPATRAAAAKGSGAAGARGRSTATAGGDRLIAVVQPPALPDPALPCAVMLLARRRAAPELAVEMLGSLFELTHAERRVLTGLLSGLTVRTLTRVHGVAESTIRSQVASLRAKLGVRRLEDLHRIAADMPPLLNAVRRHGSEGPEAGGEPVADAEADSPADGHGADA